jgi:transposase
MARDPMAGAKKKAYVEGFTIVCVDEAGFYLLPGVARTYAPRGHPPILRPVLTRDHLSVMSGITMTGHLYTMVRRKALTSADSVVFLKHLLRHIRGNVLVIWDGSPIHRGDVRTFLAGGGATRLHLEQLPPYAPDLNPDEGVWQYLKNVAMRNLCCLNLKHLHRELTLAITRLRRQPHLIQACFGGAGLGIDV